MEPHQVKINNYLSSNFYDVKLMVTNDNGCASKIFHDFIKVNTTPIIDFEASSIQLCAGEMCLIYHPNLITDWLGIWKWRYVIII